MSERIKRNFVEKVYFTNENFPFIIKAIFSTLGNIIESSPKGPIISFASDDSFRNLLGFRETILYKEYNLSDILVDILSIDKIFLKCDLAQGMIFQGRKSNIIHNWTKTGNPGYKCVEKISGGISWYTMETKDVISSISFKLRNEIGKLVSFNGQSITFRISIKEV